MKEGSSLKFRSRHYPIDAFGIRKVHRSGIRIEQLQERIRPNVPFPHKHDFYQMILIQSGGGTHQIDFRKFKVSSQQLYVLKPGQTHAWNLSPACTGLVVEFGHSSLDEATVRNGLLTTLDGMSDCHKLDKNHMRDLLRLISAMREEFESEGAHKESILKAYLNILLLKLIPDERESSISDKKYSLLNQFKKSLEKNFRVKHDVAFYAAEQNLSSKAFTMKITRATGKGPRFIIQERILLEAKRFLAYTDLSVSKIGEKLGFADANYFGRFFRIHEKCTPANFRKKSMISLK